MAEPFIFSVQFDKYLIWYNVAMLYGKIKKTRYSSKHSSTVIRYCEAGSKVPAGLAS